MVDKLVPYISLAVKNRLKKLLNTRMEATGCLPPVNIMADKATDKRDSRQLVGVLTYNPGGKNLFEAFMLGIPLCPLGTGEHLKDSIIEVVDEFFEPS